MSQSHAPPVRWSELLSEAVNKPGVISEAYLRFWNYSSGNQLMALFECWMRGIQPGPIHTFMGWKELGRSVMKGEKAITLCMPVTIKEKKKREADDDVATDTNGEKSFTRFIFRPHWFVLSQTEGRDYQPVDLPEWQESQALEALHIQRIVFDHPNGNCQGFATSRSVAVSPIAFAPHRTLYHEVAHVILGHTQEMERMDDHELTPRNIREVEAEAVALICCESLGVGDGE